MDIKLRAKLTAYSKVESIEKSTNAPDPDIAYSGNLLGVTSSGKYGMVPAVEQQDINSLFVDTNPKKVTITKDEIDKLFDLHKRPETVKKDEIDDLFEQANDPLNGVIISHAAIDSLFR